MPAYFAVTLHLGRIKTSLNGLIMVMLHYSFAWRKIFAGVYFSSCKHNTHTAKPIMRIELFLLFISRKKDILYIYKSKRTNVMSLHCLYSWWWKYKLKRCSNNKCCKQCRYVMFKGTMTKWPVQKLAQGTTQKLLQHHDATDI